MPDKKHYPKRTESGSSTSLCLSCSRGGLWGSRGTMGVASLPLIVTILGSIAIIIRTLTAPRRDNIGTQEFHAKLSDIE